MTIDTVESGVELAARVIGAEPTQAHLRAFLDGLPGVDAVGLEARAASLASRSIKAESKRVGLDLVVSLIDLTTLEGADTPGKVRSLAAKAIQPDSSVSLVPAERSGTEWFDADSSGAPHVAALCVYGDMVPAAIQALGAHHTSQGGQIRVAAVATAFPSGRATRRVKIADVEDTVAAGADEVDMVIDRGAFLSGRIGQVFDEIVAVKGACRRADGTQAHLKVILETGELADYDQVRQASWLAILAGADFIKTSTGKVTPAATLPVTVLMLEAVRDWRRLAGREVGVKPAGGIRTSKDALRYLVAVAEIAGQRWLSPELFRFGASSLLNDVLLQRRRLLSGAYSSPRYTSVD